MKYSSNIHSSETMQPPCPTSMALGFGHGLAIVLTVYLQAVEVGAVGLHKDLQADRHAGELLGTVGLQEL